MTDVKPDTCLVAVLCRDVNLQLVGDQDSFFPVSMASGQQTIAKRSSADGVASRERVPGSFTDIRPSRGAEDILAQSRTLFRAMVQMPHYTEEVSTLCHGMLDSRPYSSFEAHATGGLAF